MKKTPQTITMSKAEHAFLKQELERLRMQAEQAAARYEQAERARLAAEAERLEAQARAAKLEAEKTLLKETLEEERARLHKIIKELFARKSERYHSQEPAEGQLSLFAEQLVKLAQSPQAQKTGAAASSKPGAAKRKHPGRRPIPKDLPRLDLTLEPEEDITGCVKIGEEITEELDYIPGCFFVRRFIRPKYSRPEQAGVAIAPAPLRVIPKGIPGPMLLAYGPPPAVPPAGDVQAQRHGHQRCDYRRMGQAGHPAVGGDLPPDQERFTGKRLPDGG